MLPTRDVEVDLQVAPAAPQVRLLGQVEVVVNGRGLPLNRRQERCLLAVLMLEHGRVVAVDRLADLLWDGNPPDRYRTQLNTHVSRVRAGLRRIGVGDWVQTTRGGYLALAPAEEIDAWLFRDYLRQGLQASDPAQREALLGSALDLWHGPALTGIGPEPLRQRLGGELDELHLTAIEARLVTLLDTGRHAEASSELARLIGEHPLHEGLLGLHLRSLAAGGRAAEALQVFEDYRHRLAEQTGLDPGTALQETWLAVLRGRTGGNPPAETEPSGGPVPAAGGQHPAPVTTPAQLPADIRGFTGRTAEIAELDNLLRASSTAVVISAIAGTAGIGKTALAVHWAHHNRHHFPDGQLYINLRGFDPGGSSTQPSDAIRVLLDSLGVPPHRIPAGLDAQTATYRSILADRKILIVLDNARDPAQIRPLLPATPGSLALITSRNRLSGLIATDGAHPITLNLLPDEEARSLLAHRLGPQRVADEPEATTEIIDRCARLPLALAIAAARAAEQPHFPLRALADQLRHAPSQLDTLGSDDPATDVRAVFSCSYNTLTPQGAALFRHLGLHPGPDITVAAAASLTGQPVPQTRASLDELTRTHLITEHTPGRYSLHDLLRSYAAERSASTDSSAQRHTATQRLLDHYLHTAYLAAKLLRPAQDVIDLAPPQPGVRLEILTGYRHAQAWFAAEHTVLLTAIEHAAGAGFDTHTWQLTWSLRTFLYRQGHWHDWIVAGRLALAATQRLGDPAAQARTHHNLAISLTQLSRFGEADNHLRQALELYTVTGDLAGQARTYINLAVNSERQGRYADALTRGSSALELFRKADNRPGLALALNNTGWYQAQLGDYRQALLHCQQSLLLYQQLDDRDGQANTLDSLGYTHHHLGNHTEAVSCYLEALEVLRDLGDRYNQADVLLHLGDAYRAAGDLDAARGAWTRALTILDDLEHPDAEQARTKIASLTPDGATR